MKELGVNERSELIEPRIAVLVPCYNEEAAIGRVVQDFRAALPAATVYVYENNSKDRTAEVARGAGAIVRTETLQGKGNVVRRMFADVEADIYVLVDGDATYDASGAPKLVQALRDGPLDMVNARRVYDDAAAYRRVHQLGNALLTRMVSWIFGNRIHDMLSGYRVFSRRFVKSFPALAAGFEIETELTVHALELRMPIAEIDTRYGARLEGSASKLSTFKDGFRILWTIFALVEEERPMLFFGSVALILTLIALAFAYPLFITYFETGLVPRFPTAILATGLILLAFLSVVCGLVLDTVTLGRREMKRMQYLAVAAPK
jgi:glycosyltransferase involved in cell wall biosynthesis